MCLYTNDHMMSKVVTCDKCFDGKYLYYFSLKIISRYLLNTYINKNTSF